MDFDITNKLLNKQLQLVDRLVNEINEEEEK